MLYATLSIDKTALGTKTKTILNIACKSDFICRSFYNVMFDHSACSIWICTHTIRLKQKKRTIVLCATANDFGNV